MLFRFMESYKLLLNKLKVLFRMHSREFIMVISAVLGVPKKPII